MEYTTHTIKAGTMESDQRYTRPHFRKSEVFIETVFTEQSRYTLPSGYTESDQPTNKIGGISWGIFGHMEDSFRKGFCYWPSKDQFEIKAYYHNNGPFHYPSTGMFFDIGEVVTTRFFPDYKGNKIAFDVFKKNVHERFWYDFEFPWFKGGYWLYPYLNTPQEHDVFIKTMTN